MDKSLPPPPSSSSSENNNSSGVSTTRDQYLKHLNKLSHKISKPTIITRKPNFDPLPPPPPPQQPNQHQPPVYNINKNDFRDVVQKLTGSPAHHENRFATPPPIHPPKTESSRLQRIRPPPLAQLAAARPPPNLLGSNNCNNQNQVVIPPMGTAAVHFGGVIGRGSAAPLSPLPPFPTVHAAAESPVSAYMRFLHNSLSSGGGGDSNLNSKQQQQQQNQQYHFSGFSPLAPFVSPRWTNISPPQNQNQNQQMAQPEKNLAPPSSSEPPQFTMPPSSLPFGCLNSPRSQYGGLISPNQLGLPQLPLSPTVPVPSPRWKGY